MTVKIKKTYKYFKYLFGAYALYAVIGGFMKPNNSDNQVLGPLDTLYSSPIESVHADVPAGPAGFGDGGDAGDAGCDAGGGSCCS